MPMKREIEPNGFETKIWPGEAVKLIFNDDGGNEWAVVLALNSIPLLVTELEKSIALGRPTPIRADDIQKGEVITLEGHSVAARKGGGAVLTLFAKFADRRGGVSIPMDLPPRDLSHLVEALNALR